MERQSLIDEKQKITLADEKSGVLKVDLIQVVGRGGTAIAYKGIRHFNGEKQFLHASLLQLLCKPLSGLPGSIGHVAETLLPGI